MSITQMIALTGVLASGVLVAEDGIYNFTAIAEDGSGEAGGGSGGFPDPRPAATSLTSNNIAQPGTLTSMDGTGKDRYIVLIAGSQNNLNDDTPNPYAELGGTSMTRAAVDYGTATYYNTVDLHYVKYNDAGTPTLEWRKTNGGSCNLFALATAVFSFEVPAGSTFTVKTAVGQAVQGSSETYTLDTSGQPRMVFAALHKGNNGTTQTITEDGVSIIEFSGDAGTDELYAFGAEDEDNITASTIAYSHQSAVGADNTRHAEIVVEFVQQTPT